MRQIFKGIEKVYTHLIRPVLPCVIVISMIACSPRYVTVNGEEMVTVKKGEMDRLYQDNELLIKALEECRGE